MEEETMNQEMPERQGMMGADVAPPTTMELKVSPERYLIIYKIFLKKKRC